MAALFTLSNKRLSGVKAMSAAANQVHGPGGPWHEKVDNPWASDTMRQMIKGMIRISVAAGIVAQGSALLTQRQLREMVVQLYKDAKADLEGAAYEARGGGGSGGSGSGGGGGGDGGAAPRGPAPRKVDPNGAFKKVCAAEYAKLCVYLAARSVNILQLQIKHVDIVEDHDSTFGVYWTVVFTVHKEGACLRFDLNGHDLEMRARRKRALNSLTVSLPPTPSAQRWTARSPCASSSTRA
jgi:hypothetical protein